MLSPTLSVSTTDGPTSPSSGTRRRGLSYLRSLSSHSHSHLSPTNSATADQARPSPRLFFQRSSSYNSSELRPRPTGRRRSTSKPDAPTHQPVEVLTRVTSAGNTPNLAGEASSSSDEGIQSTSRENVAEDSMSMVRTRPRRATESSSEAAPARPTTTRAVSTNNTATNDKTNDKDDAKVQLPAIRFYPHQDQRNGRQSLNFSPISRTLPSEAAIIRVGRYSEREGLPIANPTTPSEAPVGFKSKVVSRKHCEFSFSDGQWHIRDVASSSGTFLNHIRLSQPNQESKPFPIKDGDIVQLGIDFRGGEEMIFRCVKIRIECNRSWQKKPNAFNKSRRAQLLGLTKDQPTSNNSGECSICLGSVLPSQALFVAPCAHVWHYKCIRPMLEGRQSQYPQFQCPNCRAYSDLEADVDLAEEDIEAWNENDTDDHIEADQTELPQESTSEAENGTEMITEPEAFNGEAASGSASTVDNGLLARRQAANPASPEISAVKGLEMPTRLDENDMTHGLGLDHQMTNVDSPNGDLIISGEGPLTPRNNAGPFVFDGSGGSGARRLQIPNLADVSEERS